jgi:hypothetical protein
MRPYIFNPMFCKLKRKVPPLFQNFKQLVSRKALLKNLKEMLNFNGYALTIYFIFQKLVQLLKWIRKIPTFTNKKKDLCIWQASKCMVWCTQF